MQPPSQGQPLLDERPEQQAGEPDLAYAQTLMDQGRLEEARRYLEARLERHPGWARGWNRLGVCLVRLGLREEARHAFERALAADPGYAAPWSNLGNLHYERGELDEAERAYRKAVALDPEFAAAHNNLAAVLKRRGEYGQAVHHMKLAARLQRSAWGREGAPAGVRWLVYLALAALVLLLWMARGGGAQARERLDVSTYLPRPGIVRTGPGPQEQAGAGMNRWLVKFGAHRRQPLWAGYPFEEAPRAWAGTLTLKAGSSPWTRPRSAS